MVLGGHVNAETDHWHMVAVSCDELCYPGHGQLESSLLFHCTTDHHQGTEGTGLLWMK